MTSFWQPSCVLCFATTHTHKTLCHHCLDALHTIDTRHACPQCKAFMPSNHLCGTCQKNTWNFHQLEAPFYYNAMGKYLWHQIKFYRQLLFLPQLTELMIQHLNNYMSQHQPDIIVPVPLHPWRIFNRGFNQAHELAKRIGRFYNIPVKPHETQKIKHTKAQAKLSSAKRHHNIKHSFRVKLTTTPKSILIIDDIFTTGTTVNTLAGEFAKAGVAHIDIACLFRAL